MSAEEYKQEEQQAQEGSSKPWLIRPMRPEDIGKCLSIWSRVELTEAHQTVKSGLRTDPGGFYVAELIDTGLYSIRRIELNQIAQDLNAPNLALTQTYR